MVLVCVILYIDTGIHTKTRMKGCTALKDISKFLPGLTKNLVQRSLKYWVYVCLCTWACYSLLYCTTEHWCTQVYVSCSIMYSKFAVQKLSSPWLVAACVVVRGRLDQLYSILHSNWLLFPPTASVLVTFIYLCNTALCFSVIVVSSIYWEKSSMIINLP